MASIAEELPLATIKPGPAQSASPAGASPQVLVRLRASVLRKGYADACAVVALAGLTALAHWPLLRGGTTVGVDAATYFYPMYSFLGESLRAGWIPAWNPHQLSGAPFAADPQSGWTYLPAMLCFTLLPLAAAAASFMYLTALLAGLAAYALARALGIGVAGALLAGGAYELSGRLFERNVGCFACAGLAAWLPLPILCAELAIRSRDWLRRTVWWGLAGLALSQILAIWLGQGSYYALLALGGYVVYRTLLSPPPGAGGVRARLAALLGHAAGISLFGFGLAAAGLLPRLEYNKLSNLAGGYEGAGEQAVARAGAHADWALLLERTTAPAYIGGAALALAVLAPLVAGRRFAVPFWSLLSVAALLLSLPERTPLHALLYALPGFERLHPHAPGRILALLYLAVPLLAGAAWSALPKRGRGGALFAAVPVLGALALLVRGVPLSPPAVLAICCAAALAAARALLPSRGTLVSALLLFAVLLDFLTANEGMMAARLADPGAQGHRKVNLETYYAPTAGAMFLRKAAGEGPVRYFGYDPSVPRLDILHRARFADPDAAGLLLNNRATVLGLEDVQGYNPVRLARYDELVAAINAHLREESYGEYLSTRNEGGQEYREAYVLERGLSSPLLDLLNARYIVVPAVSRPEWAELQGLERTHPVAYGDGEVRILENRDALPRAWIVHAATTIEPGEALALLSARRVDPAVTALIEEPAPPLASPAECSADMARATLHEPGRIRVSARSSTPGLLVLSEMHYPAWKAYLDGRPAHLYVVDHALSGVALPAGAHTVELRFESATLRAGLAISLVSWGVLATLIVLAAARRVLPRQ